MLDGKKIYTNIEVIMDEGLSQPKIVTCLAAIEALEHDCALPYDEVDYELDMVQAMVDEGEYTDGIENPYAKEFLQMLMTSEIELLQLLVKLHGIRIIADPDYEQPVFSVNRYKLLIKILEDNIAHPELWFPEDCCFSEQAEFARTYLARYAGLRIDFEKLDIFELTERLSCLVEAIQEIQRVTYERFLNKAA